MTKDGPRAQRFPLQLPVRYRQLGEHEWHEGRTENISRSGVLFRAENPLPGGTPIEMSVELLVARAGRAVSEIWCRGQVVRSIPPPGPESGPILAAAFSRWRLARGRRTETEG